MSIDGITPQKRPVNPENLAPIITSDSIDPATTGVHPDSNGHSTKIAVAIISIVVLVGLGFVAGWMIYKYRSYVGGLFTYSADTNEKPSSISITAPKKIGVNPSDVSAWPSYSSATYKYIVKYPDTWYSQGTGSNSAKAVVFSDYDPSISSADGFKVDIVIQNANGKKLLDWVTANSVISENTSSDPAPMTLNSKEAYQQNFSGATKSVRTYTLSGKNVVIISYSGPNGTYDKGLAIYQNLLKTFALKS